MPEGLRIYAIGDIHGRLDLLTDMHERIVADAATAGDKQFIQVFLGDYVDRGPNAKGVIDWLLSPAATDWKRICLKGNHEAILLDFLKDPEVLKIWRQYGGLETLHSYGVKLGSLRSEDAPQALLLDFVSSLPAAHFSFLSSLPLSVTFGDYFFTHAGVHPGRSLDDQRDEDLLWIRDAFLDSTADFGKIVVHGHSPKEQPELLPNRINIDTGAYLTGRLTCLVLEGAERRFL